MRGRGRNRPRQQTATATAEELRLAEEQIAAARRRVAVAMAAPVPAVVPAPRPAPVDFAALAAEVRRLEREEEEGKRRAAGLAEQAGQCRWCGCTWASAFLRDHGSRRYWMDAAHSACAQCEHEILTIGGARRPEAEARNVALHWLIDADRNPLVSTYAATREFQEMENTRTSMMWFAEAVAAGLAHAEPNRDPWWWVDVEALRAKFNPPPSGRPWRTPSAVERGLRCDQCGADEWLSGSPGSGLQDFYCNRCACAGRLPARSYPATSRF